MRASVSRSSRPPCVTKTPPAVSNSTGHRQNNVGCCTQHPPSLALTTTLFPTGREILTRQSDNQQAHPGQHLGIKLKKVAQACCRSELLPQCHLLLSWDDLCTPFRLEQPRLERAHGPRVLQQQERDLYPMSQAYLSMRQGIGGEVSAWPS